MTPDYDPQKKHLQQLFDHLLSAMESLKSLSSPEHQNQCDQKINEICDYLYNDDNGRQNAMQEFLGVRISMLADAFISTHENILTLKRMIDERDKTIATRDAERAERDQTISTLKDLNAKLSDNNAKAGDALTKADKENVQSSPRIRKSRRNKQSVEKN